MMPFISFSRLWLSVLLIISLLTSCFPDDEQEPLIPFKGIIGSTYNSIYTHQSFYSLTQGREALYNQNLAWDLGFEASVSGEHVTLNPSDLLRITNLGAISFNQTTTVPENALWLYDSSSGSTDSLAITNWVNTNVFPYQYTNNVYILGQVSGKSIAPLKKFQLIELTNNYYKLVVDELDNTNRDTVMVAKNPELNFVGTSIRNNFQIVAIEPPSAQWDIEFTQYEDSIPDDLGDLYPYLLRGAFINPQKIKVALYYIDTDKVPENLTNPNNESDALKAYFESDAITPLPDSVYSTNKDAIGWEWKQVTIDKEANTAFYKADARYVFQIKDVMDGKTYKLRFFSYYSNGVVGYPWFQFIEM